MGWNGNVRRSMYDARLLLLTCIKLERKSLKRNSRSFPTYQNSFTLSPSHWTSESISCPVLGGTPKNFFIPLLTILSAFIAIMHLSPAIKRIMFVFVLVMSVSCSGAAILKRKNLKKNSPIYYIASPLFNSRPSLNGLSSYSSQVLKHHFVSSIFSSPSKYSSPSSKQSSFSLSSPLSPSISSVYKYKVPSKTANVYKLPTKFVSNAKPIEVVKGISKVSSPKIKSNEGLDINSHEGGKKKNLIVKDSLKQNQVENTTKSRKKSGQASKLIYMPLKFISNGKTSKVKFNSLTKRMKY